MKEEEAKSVVEIDNEYRTDEDIPEKQSALKKLTKKLAKKGDTMTEERKAEIEDGVRKLTG